MKTIDLTKLSNADLYALYNMAKEIQIKDYNNARVNANGVKSSDALTATFKRITKIEKEINNRLETLDD